MPKKSNKTPQKRPENDTDNSALNDSGELFCNISRNWCKTFICNCFSPKPFAEEKCNYTLLSHSKKHCYAVINTAINVTFPLSKPVVAV